MQARIEVAVMESSVVSIRLARQEIEYMTSARFLSQRQLGIVRSVEWLSSSSAMLRLPRSSAEEFRESFTEHLARVGFDENYGVTSEGQLLEALIDRFYVA